MKRLFVDDIRRCPDHWDLARTPHQAFEMIKIAARLCQPYKAISLDHDIATNQGRIGKKTFMPVAALILKLNPLLYPEIVYIHTSNWCAAEDYMELFEGIIPYKCIGDAALGSMGVTRDNQYLEDLIREEDVRGIDTDGKYIVRVNFDGCKENRWDSKI